MDKVTLRASNKPEALMIMPSRLGDAILATPVLRQLEAYAVTLVVDPLVQDLFDAFPMVIERVSMPKQAKSLHWPRLRQRLHGKKFKRIIDLRGSWISKTWPFAKSSVWNSKFKMKKHKVEQVCACAGVTLKETYVWAAGAPSLSFKPDLILAPAANWIGKQWPAAKFRELAERFLAAYPDAHIAYVCAPHEAKMVESVWAGLPRSHPVCDGSMSLGQVAAMFRQAKLFVGNDSGLMHLAVATQLPTIALFGPTNDSEYGPFEVDPKLHTVVRAKSYNATKSLPHYSTTADICFMEDLTVDKVWQELSERAAVVLQTAAVCSISS